MYRAISDRLNVWKDSKYRKPLLLHGARQTGKTYIVDEFASSKFKSYAKVNFERDPAASMLFKDSLSPDVIISRLENFLNMRIIAGETLIFFDEIQACPKAVMSLKYFTEEARQYHVIGAGSLLGVALRRDMRTGSKVENYSFPVGKVEEFQMFPMNFGEFLIGVGEDIMAESIVEHYKTKSAMDEITHYRALDLYRSYMAIGGMPEAVQRYRDTGSFIEATGVIKNIYDDYIKDSSKYCSEREGVKNKSCYEAIVPQMLKENKNYKYSKVEEGKNKEYFSASIDWITHAGIALKSELIETARKPLEAHKNEFLFRIYLSDVGLFRYKAGIGINDVLDKDYRDDITGVLSENYVACELHSRGIPLRYWKGKRSAEIEFLVEKGNDIVPVEVKSGRRVRSKSLDIYSSTHKMPYAYRISQKNFGASGPIMAVPLYAVHLLADELAASR